MDYLRKYFKDDLVKGYSKKFSTDIPNDQTIATTINQDVYSINVTDEMISVHSFDENRVDLYLFNSKDENDVFTHYKMKADSARDLVIQGTVYTYQDDHSIIKSYAVLMRSNGNDCMNKIVFFAENYVDPSLMKTIVNILNSGDVNVIDYTDFDFQLIDDKNPYYAISKQESDLKSQLRRVRTK